MKVLITGGTRGIGLETAKLFRKNGAEVWICGRQEAALRKLEKELNVRTTVADIGRPADIERMFDAISSEWKSLDVLVNNAADIFVSPIEKMELERVRRLFDVNVFGLLDCIRRAIPLLRRGTDPAVVNISSAASVWGIPKFAGFGAYNASKFALLGITEVAALELRNEGIRVNAVSPGSVDTEMFHQNVPKEFKPTMTAGEVAPAVWFAATHSSRPMSGKNIELF
ncbi:MAG: SDR family oxidoreductase [Pseudomonadota bacterium]